MPDSPKRSTELRTPPVHNAPWLRRTPDVAPEHIEEPPKQPSAVRRIGRVLKRSAIILVVAVLLFSGLLGWKLYQDGSKLTGDKNPLSLLGAITPGHLASTGGRTNILLAGYSTDDPGHQGAALTDSIMILSVDPATKSAVILSIPRDLYVNIPGYGYSKINAAYEYCQSGNFQGIGYANGGMGLLEKTIEQNFNIHFNYDALINYAAFRDTIQAVGGVTITINSTDPRGLYDPNTSLKLPNGSVKLNGQEALNLARSRGDGAGSYGFGLGDFARTMHQQAILLAVKSKVSGYKLLRNPFKSIATVDAISKNVKTNMTLGQLETLYFRTHNIPNSSIKTVTLNNYQGQDLLTSYATSIGQSALIPAAGLNDYSAIQQALAALLHN